MTQYIVNRVLAAVVTLLGVSLLVFLMLHLLPGDPARVIAGIMASNEDVERLRGQLGLDQPLLAQYVRFMAELLQGDLGLSVRTSQPVLREVLQRLPATVQLAVASTAIAALIGISAGTVAAARPNSPMDYAVSGVTLFGTSVPAYWLGLMLIILFAVHWKLLPAAGKDGPGSFVLPSLTLAAYPIAVTARMTRSALLEVLRQDYVRTARAKGLREILVIVRHALRNALIPVVTALGLQLGSLIGGAAITESVFGWPGLGLLLVDSILARDYPMVQGVVLVFSASIILLNLAVDLLYVCLDPRIHYT